MWWPKHSEVAIDKVVYDHARKMEMGSQGVGFFKTISPPPHPKSPVPDLLEQLLIMHAERVAKQEADQREYERGVRLLVSDEVRAATADQRLDARWAALHAPVDGGKPEEVGCVGYGEL